MFRYFLDDIEIKELFGFDGASIKISQDDMRFGRDVYLFNENTELSFYKSKFTGNLTHGFEYIQSKLETKGADAKIVLKLIYNNTDYYFGRLDLENITTDGATYINCKLIDDGGRFIYKRDIDTKKTITTPPTKVLLKAKPISQESEWSGSKLYSGDVWYSGGLSNPEMTNLALTFEFNPCVVFEKSKIKDSLEIFHDVYANNSTSVPADLSTFKFIEAKSSLTNTIVSLKFNASTLINANTQNGGNTTIRFIIHKTTNDADLLTNSPSYMPSIVVNQVIHTYVYGTGYNVVNLNQDYDFNVGTVSDGEKLFMYFTVFYDNALHPEHLSINFSECKINVKTTAVSINSVIDMRQWLQLIEETSNLPVDAPIFESGFLKNVYLTNGYGIRSIKGFDFITTAKAVNDYQFLALDYQLNSDKLLIGTFEDFYPTDKNSEINEIYSETITKQYNKKFRVTDLKFGYNKYEQDRQEQGTLDLIHSYSEWKSPQDYSQGKFDRTTNIIFDVYKVESSKQLGFDDRTKLTSLDSDDDLFGLDTTPIGSEINQSYTGTFAQLTSTNNIKLLTNAFNWYSTGINQGDIVTINGFNAGSYIVGSINNIGNIITLIGANNGIDIQGLMTINYTLNNVTLKNRTNEGFSNISGVTNPSNYGNLIFTQKNVINRWLNYLSTITKYYPTDYIKMTYFKGNSNISVSGITDSSDIEHGIIFINENTIKIEVKTKFDKAQEIAKKMVQRNPDGTIGCYLIVNNQFAGWIIDFEYLIAKGMLNLTLELSDNIIFDNSVYLVDDGIFLTDNGIYLTE